MYRKKDLLGQAEEEVAELERLLVEANLRLRNIRKIKGDQGLCDWFWEIIGY